MQETKVANPYGVSLEELYRKKAKAQAAGDKEYSDYYDSLIKTEQDYQKQFGETEIKAEATQEKQRTVGLIDEILERDTKPVTGALRLGGSIPGSPAVATKAKVDQLKALLSVDAREKMKGTGQISDYESKLLQQSVAALKPSMSDEDFRAELDKIRGVLSKGLDNQESQTETGAPSSEMQEAQPQAPQLYSGEQALYRQQYGPLSPLMQKLAAAQQSLGEQQTLPALGGILGFGIAGPAGAGIGAETGEVAKQQLAKGPHLPTKQEAKEAIVSGGVSSLSSLVLSGAGKVAGKAVRPFKTAGEYRAAKIAEAQGKSISGDKIVSQIEKAGKNISPTARKSYDRYFQYAKKQFKGKDIGIDDAIALNQEANKAFTAAGKVGKSATAAFNKAMGDALKSELKITAPDVAKANKMFSLLYGGQKAAKKLTFPAQTAVIYKMLNRIGL